MFQFQVLQFGEWRTERSFADESDARSYAEMMKNYWGKEGRDWQISGPVVRLYPLNVVESTRENRV